ncbi:Pollike protein [Globisporangium polare]
MVSATPLIPSAPVAKLMATRSILPDRTTTVKRSAYRAKAKKAAAALLELTKPEDRLGAISPSPVRTLLTDLYLDDGGRAKAQQFALVDLFFRTHAPSIYVDPVKVKALCPDATISCHQYSEFLLWSDSTLTALCASTLAAAYGLYFPDHIRQAVKAISSEPDMSSDNCSSDTSGNESMPPSENGQSSL